MAGHLKRFKNYFGLLALLCFVLFGLPFSNIFQKGGVIFAYNMNNLGRSITEKHVQNPDYQNSLINHF